MNINGREIRFFRSVLANCEISEVSPEGDINRLLTDQLIGGTYAASQKAAATIITALSKGYEFAQAAKDTKYKPRPLNMNEVLSLKENEFLQLFEEAMTEFYNGGKITVEAEPEKKTGKKTAEGEKSS